MLEYVQIPVDYIKQGSKIEYIDGEVLIDDMVMLSPQEMESIKEAEKSEAFPIEFFDKLDSAKSTGELVKLWREYRGFNQTELAKKIGVSQAFISSVESNESGISIDNIKAIANVLDADIDDFVT